METVVCIPLAALTSNGVSLYWTWITQLQPRRDQTRLFRT
jgi:hypothetical protein